MIRLSTRAKKVSPSATMAISALAKDMRRQGIDVVSFSVGEPDFDTPKPVKEAAVQAIRDGFTKYTAAAGIPELKEAVCMKFKRDNDLDYEPNQVIITVGAKHALYEALQAIIDPGDEVIVPSPYWVSYLEQIKMADGEPVVVDTTEEDGFKLTAEAFRKALTPRSRVLMLNTPSNPTGAVYSEDELKSLAEVVTRRRLIVLSDEIYEPLTYGDAKHVSIASLGEQIKEQTIIIHGVSKSHAMTGWRIGFAVGSAEVIKAMSSMQSHMTSNPTSIAQKAAVEALTGSQDPVEKMVSEFAKRRNYLIQRLRNLAGVSVAEPQGAFYAFPKIDSAFGKSYKGTKIDSSFTLSEVLLKEAQVATVPGSAFGSEPNIRLSYATSMENLEKGMDRIEAFWRELK